MPQIRQLPPDIVSKIAAGEVIERPAYAVKELIENAIDAHASSITIHIENAGLRRIQVIDDGVGMSKDDLLLSFLPHTTSKILDETQLIGIKTLGFRGEALSSIAAIANLSIQSRTQKDPSGTVVEIRHGKLDHIGSIGTPPGTIVTVDDIFSSVPARRKFLKSEKTEFRHISDIILQFALSYPAIHFHLTHNKKTVIDVPGKKDETQRLSLVFGKDVIEHFLSLSFSDSYLSLSGVIGKPHLASKNNQKQFLFINNRAVSDRLISLAIKESFGTLLPASSTPLFHLHLTLPFEMVDVNVHPRKEQVSFVDNRLIFDVVKQAVSQTLLENNITFAIQSFENTARKGETTSFSATTLKDMVLPWNRSDIGTIPTDAPVFQMHQTYILAVTKDGLILIDQHAAHERILFEEFSNTFIKHKEEKNIYMLPKPQKLSLSIPESQLIDEYEEIFQEIGFSYTIKDTDVTIKKIPSLFKGRNLEKILKDMLSDLSVQAEIKTIDTISHRMLAFLSCRAAVKAGDTLSEKQIKTIISDLEKTKNNETCPHGRPTKIVLPLQLVHSYFKRV